MGNQQERFELDISWLTGIIEGEGWISLIYFKRDQKNGNYTRALTPNIGVVNCDALIINKVKELFELLNIKYRYQIRKSFIAKDGSTRKEKYEISVAAHSSVKKLIHSIFPYMIGDKKNRALKLLDFLKIRENKPRTGKFSKYGKEEFLLYKEMYSYKGKSRSKILNDLTLDEILNGFDDKV